MIYNGDNTDKVSGLFQWGAYLKGKKIKRWLVKYYNNGKDN